VIESRRAVDERGKLPKTEETCAERQPMIDIAVVVDRRLGTR
jgi:hypothetical protein